MEHKPVVLPAAAGALALAVLVDTLRSAPSLSAGEWVAALAGISVGAFVAYLTALRSRVVFDAEREEVRWHHAGWPGERKGACPLSRLRGIRVLGGRTSGGSHGLTLLTSEGPVRLTRALLGVDRDHAHLAATAGEWLARKGYNVPLVTG